MRIMITILLTLCCGCIYVPKEMALLATDAANVQRETSSALIKSIDSDIAEGKRTEKEVKELNDLKERLDYLMRANDAIAKSMIRQLSTDELAKLLKEYKLSNKEIKNELPR